MDAALQHKRERLLSLVSELESAVVAFSGGVDSAVVAQAAVLALGERSLAVTAVSPSLAEGELEIARSIAAQIGIRHVIIRTEEFAVPGYQANAGDRCFYCKTELYEQIAARLPEWGMREICNGANLDDQGDHRPGMRAAAEYKVRSPLIEAGLTKEDVRALARDWDLPIWDKPASPCLSSRVAYGVDVTPERVRRIDAAEQFLRAVLDVRELRVRLEQNDLARIEVPLACLARLAEPAVRERVTARLRELGFCCVTLDLEGFRSGSLNAALPLVALEIGRGGERS
jgi:uncharacterized protein